MFCQIRMNQNSGSKRKSEEETEKQSIQYITGSNWTSSTDSETEREEVHSLESQTLHDTPLHQPQNAVTSTTGGNIPGKHQSKCRAPTDWSLKQKTKRWKKEKTQSSLKRLSHNIYTLSPYEQINNASHQPSHKNGRQPLEQRFQPFQAQGTLCKPFLGSQDDHSKLFHWLINSWYKEPYYATL